MYEKRKVQHQKANVLNSSSIIPVFCSLKSKGCVHVMSQSPEEFVTELEGRTEGYGRIKIMTLFSSVAKF